MCVCVRVTWPTYRNCQPPHRRARIDSGLNKRSPDCTNVLHACAYARACTTIVFARQLRARACGISVRTRMLRTSMHAHTRTRVHAPIYILNHILFRRLCSTYLTSSIRLYIACAMSFCARNEWRNDENCLKVSDSDLAILRICTHTRPPPPIYVDNIP